MVTEEENGASRNTNLLGEADPCVTDDVLPTGAKKARVSNTFQCTHIHLSPGGGGGGACPRGTPGGGGGGPNCEKKKRRKSSSPTTLLCSFPSHFTPLTHLHDRAAAAGAVPLLQVQCVKEAVVAVRHQGGRCRAAASVTGHGCQSWPVPSPRGKAEAAARCLSVLAAAVAGHQREWAAVAAVRPLATAAAAVLMSQSSAWALSQTTARKRSQPPAAAAAARCHLGGQTAVAPAAAVRHCWRV